jgi:diguanylate cyclase (GGDEF)-like protein
MATAAAILLFVCIGSAVLPAAVGLTSLPPSAAMLRVALVLNVAIILFGWRRSKDLKDALTAFEEAERLALRNANTDPTTGLDNRRQLVHSLAEALDTGRSGVLLLMDLDHFKRVNDLHGHQAGDELLRHTAMVLGKAAPNASCHARIGGDEFALVLPETSTAKAEDIARTVLARISTPIFVSGAQRQVSASIGLAAFDRGSDQETVVRQSDVALYAAKAAGRNAFAWYDEALGAELAERLAMEEDMRRGISNGEFVPFFQPLIDLSTRDLVGFETLARWRSPTRGFLEAHSFIESAERTGLVAPLTMTIIEQALIVAREWPQHLKLAVNVSPVQLRDRTLAEQILKLLAQTGFPAKRLEIEITENALIEDRDQVLTTIHSLKNVGISISLDDFGTGYASLAQVNSLPFDRIKIDKSFISTIVKSEQTAAIVNTIAKLGHTLSVPITAEGVESEQMRGELKKIGCSEAQGWLFGRAVSADTVRTFLSMKSESETETGSESGSGESEAPSAQRSRVRRW